MPRVCRSTVDNLPIEMVIEIKRKLRSKSQSQLEITDWINKSGYQISKSALNRFAIKLRQEDKGLRFDPQIISVQNADVAALFEELSILKEREFEILAQLRVHL